MKHQDRVAIVIGGGSGFGRSISLRLAREGASVLVADEVEEASHTTVESILEAGGRAACFQLDPMEEASIQAMVADAVVNFGGVHLLATTISHRGAGDPLATTLRAWDQAVAIDLECVWLAARTCVPFMQAGGGGAIVTLAPLDALTPAPRSVSIATSKAGLLGLSRALAVDLGPFGIRCNTVVHGHIQSPGQETFLKTFEDPEKVFRRLVQSHPLKRIGHPEEVAAAASFLLSRDADFITGTSLVVDGGYSVTRDLN